MELFDPLWIVIEKTSYANSSVGYQPFGYGSLMRNRLGGTNMLEAVHESLRGHRHWLPWICVVIFVSILIVFSVFGTNLYQDKVKPYLPLITPLLLSIVASVIRGSAEGRLTTRGLAVDLSLGVVSFDVWAITSVMTSPTKTAGLTDQRVLDSADVILCLVLAFFLIALCSWISRDSTSAALRARDVLTLSLAVFIFFFPASIARQASPATEEQRPMLQTYRVGVAYVDSSLVKHLGPGRWGDRRLFYSLEVEAGSAEAAKLAALQHFESDPPPVLYPNYDGELVAKVQYLLAEPLGKLTANEALPPGGLRRR